MASHPLNILVTRPTHQSQPLCSALEAHGHQPLLLPTLKIAPVDGPAINKFKQQLSKWPLPDWLIFISSNAVEHSWPLYESAPDLLEQTRIAAVGSATANALSALGITVDALPNQQFDSDGLLALPPFQPPLSGRILIIRGQGGRPYLGEQLALRGAQVDYAECYQRLLPTAGADQLAIWLTSDHIDVVTITSREALRNLFKLCPADHHHLLKRLSYALLSPSVSSEATALGITGQTVIADQATDESLCKAAQNLELKAR